MILEKNDSVFKNLKENPSISGKKALEDLLPALRRLDQLLEAAVKVAQKIYGPEAASDSYRGLYINRQQAENLLKREPGLPTLYSVRQKSEKNNSKTTRNTSRLAWLSQTFGLSFFEMDIILIALASEIDLRYENLYAYLQNDVTRKRPTVDLALNLLCKSPDEKLARRIHLDSDAPLVKQGIIHLITDPNHLQPPLLAHYLKLDEQILRFLLGQDGLDPRLAECCEILEPAVSFENLTLEDGLKKSLPAAVFQARQERYPLRFYFQGPHGVGKHQVAKALAYEVGALLMTADLAQILDTKAGFDQILRLIFREAWFQNAVLFLNDVDLFFGKDRTHQHNRILEVLSTDMGITILAGAKPWLPAARLPTGTITIRFDIPGFKRRRICWQANLKKAGFSLNGRKLDVLAGRFRLTPGQVIEAVTVASNHARWRAGRKSVKNSSSRNNGQPTFDDLLTAARAQSGHDLETLARKIEPIYTWDDIVLPEDTITQLQEICQWIKHRHRVLGEWGFDRKLSLGKGANALFAGPSGTGKTMAAEIIANELGLDLYKIDLAGVVSKYIGETERNLDRIFSAAENSNAILFFDEADALFGKRSEVRDSHDRYANIEISYLLQKMEEYGGKNGSGIAILCSNLQQNLDESFLRRLAFTVHFSFPDEISRRAIWKIIWPPETPLTEDLDLDFVADQFKLSGGNIKNIALAAAFLAAGDGGHVAMKHVLRATQREYQKMGKILAKEDLNPIHQEILS